MTSVGMTCRTPHTERERRISGLLIAVAAGSLRGRAACPDTRRE
jgi:hypothetical protein